MRLISISRKRQYVNWAWKLASWLSKVERTFLACDLKSSLCRAVQSWNCICFRMAGRPEYPWVYELGRGLEREKKENGARFDGLCVLCVQVCTSSWRQQVSCWTIQVKYRTVTVSYQDSIFKASRENKAGFANLNQMGESDTAQLEFRGCSYEITPFVGYHLVKEKCREWAGWREGTWLLGFSWRESVSCPG